MKNLEAEEWAELYRLREAVKGPDGFATWQDAATNERVKRVRSEQNLAEVSSGSLQLFAENARLYDDIKLLKYMLCLAYSGTKAYMDDGEMRDQEIDYVRDSAQEIQDKIITRGINKLDTLMKG